MVLKYSFRENLPGRAGTVSNTNGFIHRYLDSGFKSKWSGYWTPGNKYIDYYTYQVNGIWIGEQSIQGTEYGEKFVFHHETDSLKVREKSFCPEEMPGFRSQLIVENKTDEPKAVQIKLETCIDIRDRDKDIGTGEYKTETGEKITVERDGRKIDIIPRNDFKTNKIMETKEHYPGEKQVCFIPAEIIYRIEVPPSETEKINTDFVTGEEGLRSFKKSDASLDSLDLGRIFNNSVESMENLVYRKNGTGIIAGHPWFQNYWARDSFWTVLGMIDAGHYELSREILENFVENDLDSRIGTEDSFNRADTEPLFIIACDKLDRHWNLGEKLEEGMQNAMGKLELEDGLVKHDPEGTWMDTLERPQAVDIQSLWLEAAEIMNDVRKDDLEDGMENFQEGEFISDHMGENTPRTVNPSVPLMLGHLDKPEEILEKLNAELSSRYGARTRSFTDPGYESSGYHSGSVWGLTTGWLAASNFRYGQERKGLNLVEEFGEFMDRGQPGAFPELVDAENGESLGCSEQAWSAGLLTHVIDTYLLGIKFREDHIEIDPPEQFECVRKNKRIGQEKVDIVYSKGEVEIKGETSRDIKVI